MMIPIDEGRGYAKKPAYRKPYVPRPAGPTFHNPESYRPAVPDRHSYIEDEAAKEAYKVAEETEKASSAVSIEDLRRKVNAKKNLEKVMKQLSTENEDPLIRQAYEELEDEDRIRRGLGPLRRAPPGKLRAGYVTGS